jgi:hypothetical protein
MLISLWKMSTGGHPLADENVDLSLAAETLVINFHQTEL